MSDDEDDYMSADFLEKCLPKDVKPGLQSRGQKREHDLYVEQEKRRAEALKEKHVKRKRHEVEEEAREEGLSKKLDSSNKGFALLAKMGYKPGQGLGKDESGRVDPIDVNVKNNRSGFGRDEARKEIAMRKCRIIEQKTKEMIDQFDPAAFRAQMREKHQARRMESDLYKAQKSCRNLDEKKEFPEPMEKFFWPPVEKTKSLEEDEEEDEEEEEEEVFTVAEKLELLITYLRFAHLYCMFCGINFENEEEMRNSCPGPSREDHDD